MPGPIVSHAVRVFKRAGLLLAAAGCSGSLAPGNSDAPRIEISVASVAQGTEVSVRIRNESATEWGYNLCSNGKLQYRDGGAWVDTPSPLALCTDEITIIQADAVSDVEFWVPLGVATGTYRILIAFTRSDGARASPVTNSFFVN